jgi:hypothetical protein
MSETMPALRPIPDADKRRRHAELEQQRDALVEARAAASRDARMAKTNAVEETMWVPFRAALEDFQKPFNAVIDEIEAAFDAKEEALDAEMEALGLGCRHYDDDYSSYTCALTGLPVFEGDAFIRDEESGDVILRDALPWPETTS